MIVAVTGHRPYKIRGKEGEISMKLRQLIVSLKPDKMISGMALGVDTIWAELALEYKIPLVAAIPFDGQAADRSPRQLAQYSNILNRAEQVVNVSGNNFYRPYFMQLRNIWMVDNSDTLVAVYNGDTYGGTFNCLKYARTKTNYSIITVNI